MAKLNWKKVWDDFEVWGELYKKRMKKKHGCSKCGKNNSRRLGGLWKNISSSCDD
jgi:ribosomal protein L37AE/L43A